MKIELDIHEGKLIIELVDNERPGGKDKVMARGEIVIEGIFDEMARIEEERRIEAAREVTRANYRPRR
jgi:hypothetical protein